jgi:hypothetical protein
MLLMSAAATPGFADEIDELRKLRDTTIALVNALVEQGVLTRAKADALIAQAEQAGAKSSSGGQTPSGAAVAGSKPAWAAGAAAAATPTAQPVEPGVVRVPYVPETVKQEISNEVKQDVLAQAKTERWGEPGAFPDWLKRIDFYGDMRFRAEADRFPHDNTPNAPVAILQAFGVNIANSTDANNRLRIRARFGLDAHVADSVTVGIRLASGGVGAGSNPGSENQTLGNYETRSTVGFDRAYIAYTPASWFALSAGRVGNPFFEPTTLIWADDVSLEGIVVGFRPQVTHALALFATAGAFPILQVDPVPLNSAESKWMYGYQTGLDLHFNDASSFKFAAALYDYHHIEGIPNPTIYSTDFNATAAAFRQTGNTVFDINGLLNTQNGTQNYLYGLASKFREANLSTRLDLGFVGPTHVILDGDYVRNIGFNEREIIQRTGFPVNRQIVGWQTRLMVGYPTLQQKYSWQAFMGYRYAQRDSVLDAFTEQDFHLGGTDAQGYYLGARFAFEKNTAVTLRWYSSKQIDGVELAGADRVLSGLPLAIDVAQLDITASF